MSISTNTLLGNSEAFGNFQDQVARLAKVDKPIFIWGERGTGKENTAKSLHYLSTRWDKPFITILCSALSPTLLEDALFGHEQGSFTGAQQKSIGYFERAHTGTLFLDEVADIPISTQEKLLRILEYGTFERIGGQKTIEIDVRLVAATNKNIKQLVEQKLFREDLLDRLVFDVIKIPPLREREEDILLLAQHFAQNMALELGITNPITFAPSIEKLLMDYPWYGNVRELKSTIERTVFRLQSTNITEIFLNPLEFLENNSDTTRNHPETISVNTQISTSTLITPSFNLINHLEETKKNYIHQALAQTKYNQKEAAKLLGLTYHQFRNFYKQFPKTH